MRRAILVLALLFAVALPCQAGDKAKPNTLTPKEIADGWILLFDGETTFGWSLKHPQGKNGLKIVDGAMELTAVADGAIRFATVFSSFELRFDYSSEGEALGFDVDGNGAQALFGLVARKNWTPVVIEMNDGHTIINKKQNIPIPTPYLLGFDQRRGRAMLRNIKLRPLNTKSLFNGKDLTGWKEFPGRKSKFTVTDKGEINVTNGNGDLQTVGKYQDFVLQLECICNGKHLNSGIFFRCKDNEYQNGYEAQILNKFTAEATQDYTIEEYDPKTNKLLAKTKIKSTAVDFGTGAIYRRVPARKEMSKDGEWFGMTIVAHGNHLATWVNGVQVTDWYDNRPRSNNPRNGCRLEAGHISIQGHDPTTNLSFRNLRIAELPAK